MNNRERGASLKIFVTDCWLQQVNHVAVFQKTVINIICSYLFVQKALTSTPCLLLIHSKSGLGDIEIEETL